MTAGTPKVVAYACTKASAAVLLAAYGLDGRAGQSSVACPSRDAAVHLVGGHLQEAMDPARVARRVEQRQRPVHVGVQERRLVDDAAIDVRLGGEVHDHVDPLLAQQARHRLAVGDVAALEAHARVREQIGQVREIAGVGEQIDGHQPRRRRAPAHRPLREPGARSWRR